MVEQQWNGDTKRTVFENTEALMFAFGEAVKNPKIKSIKIVFPKMRIPKNKNYKRKEAPDVK